ncbi:MAG: peptide chain release factor N(5)-glutamine methyltransferase [Leptospirales bacterium]|jgi:release factor glutamine methyltransferase
MRIAEALGLAIEALTAGGIPAGARFEAENLLADLLRVDRLRLRSHSEIELTPDQAQAFDERIRRRAGREPAAHILGFREFHRYRFSVSPEVLIPRPETEQIIDLATGEFHSARPARILDLCTGSGCIGITLLQEFNQAGLDCDVVLTDLSSGAIAMARKNLVQVAPDFARRCRLYQGDLDEALPEAERVLGFHIIVSNPPYIGTDEAEELAPEVRDFEPAMALFHADPLALYRRIFVAARELLTDDGVLLLELGPRFAKDLRTIAGEFFARSQLRKDYAGLDRVLVATEPRR